MPLPMELSSIFRNKQKSYKMVLILSIIDEYRVTLNKAILLDNVVRRFLAYYQSSIIDGKRVDSPPSGIASNWSEFTLSQTKSLLYTPIKALSSILEENSEGQTLSFKSTIWDYMNESMMEELHRYALTELDNYNNNLAAPISLKQSITQIMNSYVNAKTQVFTNHSLGALLRQTLPTNIKRLSFIDEKYKVQGSIGQGNWANIPWLAILDKRITETTQYGEYVVYLFAEDMNSVYLTLAQGVTLPLRDRGRKEGYQYLEQKVREMRELLPLEYMQKDDNIHLTSSGLGRDYQVSTVAYIRYERDNIPEENQLISDLENMVSNYKLYAETVTSPNKENEPLDTLTIPERIEGIKTYINQKGFHYPGSLIENLYLSLKTKPFVILAGISGTGKTKLVKLFAEALGATIENKQFSLIPVRPDWSDPSDLLGYKDLSGVFRPGQLANVLIEASKAENYHKPYFICLDEMNLARVEHYFSDVLSIIETQEWKNNRIVTAPLIFSESLSSEDQKLYGNLALSDNVYLVGTVNMDETTHPFSKKVLDRANAIEFNYICLSQFPDTEFDSSNDVGAIPADNFFLRSEYLQLVDVYQDHRDLIHRTTEKLVKINSVLEEIHSQVGFRIRDAVCFYIIYNKRFQLLSEDAAFDQQLLQKILPRVQGSSFSVKRVLLQLMQVALGSTLPISELMEDASVVYMRWSSNQTVEEAQHPQTARKIAFMLRRLEEDGFTSYWLS
ncbi:MrcB family domain-containing protein [Paenibacillus sp. GCM10027627]|uniref:MrcB family domain-containing protein n=1 Tax=unclassified Paenibacillus TaxID=185978 RepID=UPI00362867E7